MSLYVVHVMAIALGQKPPYVEENYRFAENCLWNLIPSGLGLIVGVGIRVAVAAFGWSRRRYGRPIEFLPTTTRGVMVTVACIAVGLSGLHRVIFPPTVYSARYDESRFNAIRAGMTTEQVLSELGEPIAKAQWSQDGLENWMYSTGYTDTSNYDRRWIFVRNGSVDQVIIDYWYD